MTPGPLHQDRDETPRSRFQDRDFRITTPGPRLQNHDFRTTTPGPRLQDHDSRTTTPGARLQNHDSDYGEDQSRLLERKKGTVLDKVGRSSSLWDFQSLFLSLII